MNKMALRLTVLALSVYTLAGACSGAPPTDPLRTGQHAVVDATVQLLNLEGGCWTLAVGENVHYLPLNLADSLRRDGLAVRAELVRRDDYASICMVGPVVQILSIQTR